MQDKTNPKFENLLNSATITSPQVGDIIKGTVLSASKSAVKMDIDGIMIGIVRGRELYREAPEYANLKEGDEVEATVIDLENEDGELELSFSYAGHQKAWATLTKAFEEKEVIIAKVKEANKGGLVVTYGQIMGFLPVSQLSPENYPRVSGGDKTKILEKLRSFVGNDTEVKVMDLSEKEDKLIVSEKMAWSEKQKDVISQYKSGSVVEGTATAITNFGVFISFGDNLEGLIHISELAWQRIENPADLIKVGEKIKAEIINIDGAKIFLSAKKLLKDPWMEVAEKYKINAKVKGLVLKVNPFGLFVKLDDDIHALAHVTSLAIKEGESVESKFEVGKSYDFYVISMEPNKHRLGLGLKPIKDKKSESLPRLERGRGEESESPKVNPVHPAKLRGKQSKDEVKSKKTLPSLRQGGQEDQDKKKKEKPADAGKAKEEIKDKKI
ncbi:MAG: S1 RNA-binding domain-containing protein [Candidatus Falkowbacteria bacterium]